MNSPPKHATIEIGTSGCTANCSHCPQAASRLGKVGSLIDVKSQRLASLVSKYIEVVTVELPIDLDICSPLSSTSIDTVRLIGGERYRVVGLNISLDQNENLEEELTRLNGVVIAGKKHYPNLERLTLVFNRGFEGLDLQMEKLPAILDWIEKNRYILPRFISIALGSNEVPIDQIENIFETYSQRIESEIDQRYSQPKSREKEVEVTKNSHQDLWYHGLRIGTGNQKVSTTFGLFTDHMKGAAVQRNQIIQALEKESENQKCTIHFGRGRVNIFHSTYATNTPGVWVSYDEFDSILDRAIELGNYNQALVEHFRENIQKWFDKIFSK